MEKGFNYKVKTSRRKFIVFYILVFSLLIFDVYAYINFENNSILVTSLSILFFLGLIGLEIKHFSEDTLYLTDAGIRKETGVFNKSYSDINYKDVLRTTVTQKFLERVLNYGTLYIDVAGMAEAEMILKNIPNPLKYKKLIDDLVDSLNEKNK